MKPEAKAHEFSNSTMQLLKGSDVARILNVSRAFAYRLMAQGEVPTVRLGRAVRVRPRDLTRFIATRISDSTGALG